MTRVVTLGEIMLRLSAPGHERLFQSANLQASFGGGEANVAVSLAGFGIDAALVTALPDGPLGAAAIAELRRHGVDTSRIVRSGERIGIYFLETGADDRPSLVVYDRAHSAISEADRGSFDWDAVFHGVDWFHVSGITPALSQNAADLCFDAVDSAKRRGAIISCDYNFRAKLWRYGKQAPEVMRELVRLVDVGIANEEDCQRSLGIALQAEPARQDAVPSTLDLDRYGRLCAKVLDEFPNLRCQAITLRTSHSASHNEWSACLCNRNEFLIGPSYDLAHITDRVGAGDSFAAGLIYALLTGSSDQHALDFAVAASALKHTIPGDFNLVTLDEVQRLAAGEVGGRIQR
jgi:2-dehydro-3-deoxygluconokinase